MHWKSLLFLVVLTNAAAGCTKALVRREWRALTAKQKTSYINAVKCLQNSPATTSSLYTGVRSRFDDFQAEHINQTDFIHFVGHFQAWHRMFVAFYESELRSTCGYTGAQPYWDWSLDTASEAAFLASPVFDPVYGFGGNGPYIDSSNDTSVRLHIPGKTGGGCIEDGPFKNRTVSMKGVSTDYAPHCLRRDLAPSFAITKLNQTMVDWTLAADDFFHFDIRVQGAIDIAGLTYHGGGHLGVGGDLGDIGDVNSSPGDPLFFLHHANMDRLWYKWQRQDWAVRKADIAGPDTGFAYPYDFFGPVPYQNVTLDFEMAFHELIPGKPLVAIREVMDPQDGLLCYKYA